jgi:hypothetical protein
MDNLATPKSTDAFIDSLIETGAGRNNLCPCGCGKKQKKVDIQQHENNFHIEYNKSLTTDQPYI